jgi:uncharacterized protein YcbX
MEPMDTAGTLSEIVIYPLKSAGGISLSRARVDRFGLEFDRRWLVVDEAGVFLTQRQLPRMSLITPELLSDSLLLKAPGMVRLELPLQGQGGPGKTVQVWDDRCRAIPLGKEADDWVSAVLETPCHLMRFSEAEPRTVDPTYAHPADRVGFADGFPFLLISEASLTDLNTRLDEPLPMNRFRPNLVVRGVAPYAEDSWKDIRLGDIGFRVVKPCARCSITTVEQTTGVLGKEPLRTLATYRRTDGKVMFGQNLIHDAEGVLSVGDTLTFI